ncbi:MAG: hypothetical protein K8T26_11070 [Lentisphaerae bacterium]|nr:hypothetical protein [Lentisphaerota bacterium]
MALDPEGNSVGRDSSSGAPAVPSAGHVEDGIGQECDAGLRVDAMGRLLGGKSYVSDETLRDLLAAGALNVSGAVRTLLVMHMRAGRDCWISAKRIASILAIDRRRVEHAVDGVVRAGFLHREGRNGQRRRLWKLPQSVQYGSRQSVEIGNRDPSKAVIRSRKTGSHDPQETGSPQEYSKHSKEKEASSRSKTPGAGAPERPDTTTTTQQATERHEATNGATESSTESASTSWTADVAGELFRSRVGRLYPSPQFYEPSFVHGSRLYAKALSVEGCDGEMGRRVTDKYIDEVPPSKAARMQWNAGWAAEQVHRIVAALRGQDADRNAAEAEQRASAEDRRRAADRAAKRAADEIAEALAADKSKAEDYPAPCQLTASLDRHLGALSREDDANYEMRIIQAMSKFGIPVVRLYVKSTFSDANSLKALTTATEELRKYTTEGGREVGMSVHNALSATRRHDPDAADEWFAYYGVACSPETVWMVRKRVPKGLVSAFKRDMAARSSGRAADGAGPHHAADCMRGPLPAGTSAVTGTGRPSPIDIEVDSVI